MMTDTMFRFNSGRLSLDLPATVRRRASSPTDVLARPEAGARWLNDAGLATELTSLSDADFQALLTLREAVWALADAARRGVPLPPAAVAVVNTAATRLPAVPQLDPASMAVRRVSADPVGSALAAIAHDAIGLIGGPLRNRLKACAQPDCQMLFLDTSRSARRRWCSMDRCGSRAKGSIFRQRHKGDAHG